MSTVKNKYGNYDEVPEGWVKFEGEVTTDIKKLEKEGHAGMVRTGWIRDGSRWKPELSLYILGEKIGIVPEKMYKICCNNQQHKKFIKGDIITRKMMEGWKSFINPTEEDKKTMSEYLTVESCKSEFIKEDGYEFGLWEESGYIFKVICRDSSPEEIKKYEDNIEKKKTINNLWGDFHERLRDEEFNIIFDSATPEKYNKEEFNIVRTLYEKRTTYSFVEGAYLLDNGNIKTDYNDGDGCWVSRILNNKKKVTEIINIVDRLHLLGVKTT